MNEREMNKIVFRLLNTEKKVLIPYVGGINAGFTSPAQDYLASEVDLNDLIVKHPSYTYMAYADGECLSGSDVADRDLVIVDKSIEPKDGALAVCYIDGDFTMKRICLKEDRMLLMPDPNDADRDRYRPIEVTEENRYIIWGIVTYVIKKVH